MALIIEIFAIPTLAALVAGVLALCAAWLIARPSAGAPPRPPHARRWRPIIGHALAYKADAAAFLSEQCRDVGAVFRLNLAGKRMVVVGADRAAVRQIASASEAVLSSREATLDIGFEQTLGALNVRVGTEVHKRLVKETYGGQRLDDEVPALHAALGRAFAAELAVLRAKRPARAEGADFEERIVVPDILALVRAVVLRAVIERLLGPAVLDAGGAPLVAAFMSFQDLVEDATAKAAVLPRPVALALALWPCQARRKGMSALLIGAFEAAGYGSAAPSAGLGPWLQSFARDGMGAPAAAELTIGLLFAAHKNPAIGAAQAVLLALEHGGAELDAARADARALHAVPDAPTLRACAALRRAALEALRVSAHPLGAVRKVMSPSGFVVRGACGSWAVRRGETIALTHVAVHRDAALWGRAPDEYAPRRPEWSDGGRDVASDEYRFTTFSQGVHRCPGASLALVIVQSAAAHLLGGDFEAALPGPPPPLCFERATLAQRRGAASVVLAPRGAMRGARA